MYIFLLLIKFDQYKRLLHIAGHYKSFELVKNSATKTHTDFITLLMIIGYQLLREK